MPAREQAPVVRRGSGVESADELRAALTESKAATSPVLIRVRIGTETRKTPYFLEDPVVLADTFRRYVAEPAAGS